MENFRTRVSVASLPPDVPEQVRLMDEGWLHEQTSNGAKLALIGPDGDGPPPALSSPDAERYEQRLRELAFRLGAAQLEVDELKRNLELAEERPLRKRLFSRP